MVLTKRPYKEIVIYLGITFSVTWLIWLGAYIASSPTYTLPIPKDWFVRLGTAVPSVTGIILTRLYVGRTDTKTLLRSLVNFKISPIWWCYATALFPLVLFVSSMIFLLLGGSFPAAQFPLWFIPIAFFYILVFMGPLGEELGWRGFLLKRLMDQWGEVWAGCIIGIIWSVWHIPLFFINGTIQYELAKIGTGLAVTGYFIYTTCISLLISVLYTKTKKNLLLCVIFHTVCNLSLGIVPLILTKSGATILLATLALSSVLTVKMSRQVRSK